MFQPLKLVTQKRSELATPGVQLIADFYEAVTGDL